MIAHVAVISHLAFNFISDQLLYAEYSRLQPQITYHFKIQRPTVLPQMTGLLQFCDVGLEAKSSLEYLACTLTTHVCQCCVPLPLWTCCCHVIFALVTALSWWGSISRCEWPSEALTPPPTPQPAIRFYLPSPCTALKKAPWFML